MLQLQQEYSAIRESSSFDEIGTFASHVMTLKEKFDLPELYALAQRIRQAADGFDIEEINKTTVELPELIQRIMDRIENTQKDAR